MLWCVAKRRKTMIERRDIGIDEIYGLLRFSIEKRELYFALTPSEEAATMESIQKRGEAINLALEMLAGLPPDLLQELHKTKLALDRAAVFCRHRTHRTAGPGVQRKVCKHFWVTSK